MAVQEGPSFKRYAANGIATVYSIPFLLLSGEDLVVTLDGIVVSSGFTLSGIGNPTSTATFGTAPSGDLLFRLVIPFQRLADYQLNGDFLASTVNKDFDRLWLGLKELRRDDQRALSVDPLEPEGIPPLPVAALRQSRMLAFDENGDPTPSNLTVEQLEQQPLNAAAAASAAQVSAQAAADSESAASASATASGNEAAASAISAELSEKWAENPEDVPVTVGPNKFSALHWAAKAAATVQWTGIPVGVPIPIWDHIAGVSAPPTGNPDFRYIKLTASDGYNTGVLTSESVSGSAPLVQATAVISDVTSPLNGQTVRLINTERRALRAGSSGTVEADAFQDHGHPVLIASGSSAATIEAGRGFAAQVTASTGGDVAGNNRYDTQNSTGEAHVGLASLLSAARTANETRAKNIGATYYLRIR